EIEAGAIDVHGITGEFLLDKPKLRDVAKEFLDFVAGAELIIHNAAFDVGFLDYELALLELKPIGHYASLITDTLKMAKGLHPGKRNSLDALCERYQIDNSARTLHGALLDARLLAEVYLSMTRGQESLIVEQETLHIAVEPVRVSRLQQALAIVMAGPEELAAHERELADIQKASAG